MTRSDMHADAMLRHLGATGVVDIVDHLGEPRAATPAHVPA